MKPKRRFRPRFLVALLVLAPLLIGVAWRWSRDSSPVPETLKLKMQGKSTVADRVREFGPAADSRWAPFFQKAGAPYPPEKLIFVAFKAEKQLQIFAPDAKGKLRLVRQMPILAASGTAGPKQREGDLQVPEGFYQIESLNPNSAFHLSLRVNYPNRFDQKQAAREGRENLGGNIMIHGNQVSIGCLAMGDQVAEDLFVLAARTGREKIDLWIAPHDFRSAKPLNVMAPNWIKPIYTRLEEKISRLPQ